ncbi:MAG TPA: hypothetical protein PLE60_01490 [Candidatus Latescibacteria bacterium]|nr:hypothetical protein [Candidatus Latescibacterota bacterium]
MVILRGKVEEPGRAAGDLKTTPPDPDVEGAVFRARPLKQNPGRPGRLVSPSESPVRSPMQW